MSLIASYSNLTQAPMPLPVTQLVGNGTLDASATFTRLTGNASYYDATPTMQFAAANVPRWDHDPVTGAALGLLIEQQRTNYIPYSVPSSGHFIATNQTYTIGGGAIGPDGTASTRTTLPNGGTSQNYPATPSPAPTMPAGDCTCSFWLKNQSATTKWALLYLVPPAGGTNGRIYVNIADGTIVNSDTPPLEDMQQLAGGWYRCITSGRFVAQATSQIRSFWTKNSTDGINFVGDGTSNDVWGWQFEGGLGATSYIPTNGAAISRAKDTLTYPAPAAAGTILLDHDAEADASLINTNSTDILTSQGAGKIAIAWDASGTSVCYNGGAVTHGAAITWGSDYELLKNANAHIKPNGATKYLTKLSDAELQAATT